MHLRVVLLLLFISHGTLGTAQTDWQWVERQPMPVAISNNAVTATTVNGNPYVYSFAGIDTSKEWSGITLKSFRYDFEADRWNTLPPLPDTMGKIAAGPAP